MTFGIVILVVVFCIIIPISFGGKRSTCERCNEPIQACSSCEWRTGKERGTVWHHKHSASDRNHRGVPV